MVKAKEKDSSPVNYPSLVEIKNILPDDCFKPSLPLSIYYVVRAFVMVSVLIAGMRMLYFDSPYWLIAYAAYPFCAGTLMWGIFVLGHDCGHGSFSTSSALNFFFGTILHSFILVPYYHWKLTHHSHHKNTGHLDNDEIFFPVRKSRTQSLDYKLLMGSARTVFAPFLWFFYLAVGYPPKHAPAYHFWPWYAKFRKHANQILLSHVGWFGMAGLLYLWAQVDGWEAVLVLYFVPLWVFGLWLVLSTFLHHNEAGKVKWYAGEKWSYVKGNLSSIDRTYGSILDNLTHNISTHQVHHLFPLIPHYKLKEATSHFRKAYPELVFISEEPIIPIFISNLKSFSTAVIDDDIDEHVC